MSSVSYFNPPEIVVRYSHVPLKITKSRFTGKCLHRYQCTELPIEDDVIYPVRDLVEEYNAKKMTNNYQIFDWAPGVLITDDVSEEDKPTREGTEINNNEPEG